MKRRLSAFFGDDRERPARGYAGAKQAFVAAARRAVSPARARGSASRKRRLAPQSKLGRKARLPAREIMILSIALGHPALIESHCEELAATEFMGAGVSALRDALLAAPAEALDLVRRRSPNG